ncbi:MAG: hypothetical protein AVDCRST_MAG39-1816 [uncultured Sphingomonadaceae bacterium]|uniref:C-type lysozyme inhibitor domain-containing protein n=1 Tax=uncultured Sphingomonadaceae bacterium TaxID=169976 RepID=A0A6J4SXD6_9SPHN|nr:MAG: hypothetical protein AVDCRST_MAG39-1816 [uncultured Sphingomonadaceae bacterium]
MTKHLLLAAAFAAVLPLAACGKPETITAPETPDAQADELAKAAPVALPPAIRESRTYRCKDNSVVYASFLTDGTTVEVRDAQEEPPIATLKAPAAGEPFVGGPGFEGFKLVGSGETVTYTSPDSGTQSCKA